MSTPSVITIDGVTYTPTVKSSEIKIVVLQRGWVFVGRWSQDGEMCALDDASVIRVWGTKKGLGELRSGPTSTTVLDPAGHIDFHILTMVLSLECEEGRWSL